MVVVAHRRERVVVAPLVLGPFVYIHFIEPDPAPRSALGHPSSTKVDDGAAAKPSPAWQAHGRAGSGSKDQYRVNEVLFGQDNTATGSPTRSPATSQRSTGTTVQTADITVDLTTVKSDEDRRDSQFTRPHHEHGAFPDASFKLSQPIALRATAPKDGTPMTVYGDR